MALEDTLTLIPADDGYEAFYAEKIWRLVPGLYRDEDAKTKTPGALRAFVEILAEQAAAERRSIDRLWSDTHITDCDDWAIPYIADLLATRLISEQNTAGRRADVAKTIYYRRRAGTLQLFARLADDIANWDGAPSEAFRRLFRTWHSLDCPALLGRVSRTPQGGLASIRGTRLGEVVDTAWDEVAHFPDFRRHRGLSGRYNIPKINLHLFRQFAFLVQNVTPYRFDAQHYMMDPSGRDIALFKPGQPFVKDCRVPEEWDVRGPILCGLLNDGRYRPGADAAAASIGAGLLVVEDELFLTAADLVARAEHIKGSALTIAQGRNLLNLALLEDSAKAQLIQNALALAIGNGPVGGALSRSQIYGGDLSVWETIDPDPWPWARAVVDPARGRVFLRSAPGAGQSFYIPRHHYGMFEKIGAGTYDRDASLEASGLIALPLAPPPMSNPGPIVGFDLPGTGAGTPAGTGIYQMSDSRTYLHTQGAGMTTTGDLTIQAGNGERPYVVLNLDNGTTRWVIDADNDGDTLVLDGLWLGLMPDGHGPTPDPGLPAGGELVIAGDFETVILRHMTLDPGGFRARITAGQTEVIPTVTLLLEGAIDRLIIDRSITGPIEESALAGDRCTAHEICILDSIVRGPDRGTAIQTRNAKLEIARTTVFGDVFGGRFLVEDSLIQGTLSAQDPQGSCVRYSAAEETEQFGIPNAYRCVHYPEAMPNHLFVSRRFGDAGFAQLSQTAPETVRRGAENTSEMGAMNRSIDAIKRDDLIRKLAEFTGINVIPQLIFET